MSSNAILFVVNNNYIHIINNNINIINESNNDIIEHVCPYARRLTCLRHALVNAIICNLDITKAFKLEKCTEYWCVT